MVEFMSTNTSLEIPTPGSARTSVIEGNKVTIIDVCCPFDNDRDALQTAVTTKETKYADLKQALAADGKDVEVFGFAVGSLVSWHHGNE